MATDLLTDAEEMEAVRLTEEEVEERIEMLQCQIDALRQSQVNTKALSQLISDEELDGAEQADDPITRRYAELELKRRDLEASLKAVKEQIGKVEAKLLDQMSEMGMRSCRVSVDVDGTERSLTLYLSHEFYCSKKKGVETRALCEELSKHGLGYLVKAGYSGGSLKSVLREWRDSGVQVPDGLAAMLNIIQPFKVRTRK